MLPNETIRYNILCFTLISTLLFGTALPQTVPAADDDTATAILEKLSRAYLTEAMTTAGTIEELAETAGITTEELERVCETLGIDLAPLRPAPPVPADLLSYRMLASDEYEPEAIIEYADGSPYVLLVEKSTHTLFLLKYENGIRELVAAYDCKTGKHEGDKQEEGDEKTPEGVFYFTTRYSRQTIRSMVGANAYQYGEMAFVTDYPNPLDELNGKDGSGIWLHGTDEPFSETSSLNTRGCVVTTNETIRELEKYITLNRTPMIVSDTISFISKDERDRRRDEYHALLYGWRDDWLNQRIDEYMNRYHPLFSQSGRNRTQWRQYKKGIFDAVTIEKIDLSHIVILRDNDGMVLQFDQDYAASNLSSYNVKVLYLAQSGSSWEIAAETLLR